MVALTPQDGKLYFNEPLKQARVVNRPNRFVVYAELEGRVVKCHSPVTGRIGGLTLDGLPCLLSGPYSGTRTTEYTVEAIGLEAPASPTFQWVGINQTAVNSYVEAAFKANMLAPLLPAGEVKREQALGTSRIDFLLYGDLYMEVKMPLLELATFRPATIPYKDFGLGSDSPRFLKQLEDLMDAMRAGKRTGQLTVFAYEQAGPMSREEQLAKNITTHPVLHKAEQEGLERWRLDLKLTPTALQVASLEEVSVS